MGASCCLNVTTRKAKEHPTAVALKLGRKEGFSVLGLGFFLSVERGGERKKKCEGTHGKLQDNFMITQPGMKAAIYRASKHMRLPSPVFCVALSMILPSRMRTCCTHMLCLIGNFQSDPCIWWGLPPRDQLLVTKEAPDKKKWQKGEKGEESWRLSCIRQKALHHSAAITASSICDSSAWPILNCDLLKYTSTWILCYIWGPQFYHIVFKKTWLFCRLFAFSLACSPFRTLQLWQKKIQGTEFFSWIMDKWPFLLDEVKIKSETFQYISQHLVVLVK